MKLELPSVAEQRRVIGVLSAYGELVDNNRRQNRVLDEVIRVFFREMFPLQNQVCRNVAPVPPAGWSVESLGSLAEEVRRNVAPKGELGDNANYVGLEHIPRRSLALDDWLEVAELGSSKLAFQVGEVLFGKIRPYFHQVSVAPFDGICSADTIVLRPRNPEDYGLVVAVVSSDAFVQHATATSNGAKMPRASWSVLRDYPVLVLSLEVRERFSEFVKKVVALQCNLVFQNRNLRQTRDLLLPRLLSGQIELPHADEALAEAASAAV
jgi:type I restriction enzyme S subunit